MAEPGTHLLIVLYGFLGQPRLHVPIEARRTAGEMLADVTLHRFGWMLRIPDDPDHDSCVIIGPEPRFLLRAGALHAA
jgi:hypothetical protein